MPYFIYTEDNCDLQIDVDIFEHQLGERWSDVKVDNFSLQSNFVTRSWWVTFTEENQEVTLDKHYRSVWIDNCYDQTLAEFLVWYRSVIPIEYRLFVAHDSWGEEQIELTRAITEAQIIRMLESIE
jgi:hypothetical protein